MLKQVVLVKQVPATAQLAFDAETRTLKREGVRLEVSSFDVRAVLRALELGEGRHGGPAAVGDAAPASRAHRAQLIASVGPRP